MTVDIEGNVKAFLVGRAPGARYASFDYCYNYFQGAREAGETEHLADEDRLLLSCLHLGFYLASWGMLRGSSDLLQRSVQEFVAVVEQIFSEPASTWDLETLSLTDTADDVLGLSRRIQDTFSIGASDILLTKTMLGVFGCVPSSDRYFRKGFGCHTLCKRVLTRIGTYYDDNQAEVDAVKICTLDFATGLDTKRCYPKSKIIDMIFFQKGLTGS